MFDMLHRELVSDSKMIKIDEWVWGIFIFALPLALSYWSFSVERGIDLTPNLETAKS